MNILGVKYYVAEDTEYIPYGYTLINTIGDTNIYKNNYSLSFATLYKKYITIDKFEELEDIKKENMMLKAVSLENNVINEEYIEENTEDLLQNTVIGIDYKSNINDNKMVVESTQSDNLITLDLGSENIGSGELYVKLSNLEFRPFSKDELININLKDLEEDKVFFNKYYEKANIKNTYKYYQESYEFKIKAKYSSNSISKTYNDKITSPYAEYPENYLVNLGYYDSIKGKITITLSTIGNYSWDSIDVYIVKFDNYEQDVQKLNKSNFNLVEYSDNYMKATVNAESSGVLQFSTLYNKDFSVYVDGKQVKTFQANKYFLGIYITEGEHDIELVYNVPYLTHGIILSLIGIVIFIIIVLIEKRNRK